MNSGAEVLGKQYRRNSMIYARAFSNISFTRMYIYSPSWPILKSAVLPGWYCGYQLQILRYYTVFKCW